MQAMRIMYVMHLQECACKNALARMRLYGAQNWMRVVMNEMLNQQYTERLQCVVF